MKRSLGERCDPITEVMPLIDGTGGAGSSLRRNTCAQRYLARPRRSQRSARAAPRCGIPEGVMQIRRRQLLGAGLGATALAALPGCSDQGGGSSGAPSTEKKVEVFSWWSGPGEGEGLAALIEDFKKQNPGVEFVNAAVAGGSGTQARQVLTTRLLNNDPPDSYQLHAGQEAASDIKADKLEDITYLYDAGGWKPQFPKGLLDK